MNTPQISSVFLLWDYDARTLTKFRKEGACNQCGICCQRKITFAVVNPVEKGNLRQGGWFTSGQGQWIEARVDDQRVFFRMRPVEQVQEKCKYLGEDFRCQIYEDRWLLCRTWPHSPFDLIKIPECSYSFQILGHWRFDELRFLTKEAGNGKRKVA
jgi:Fe-S-cluster containining protein